jgi:hypothetical protein
LFNDWHDGQAFYFGIQRGHLGDGDGFNIFYIEYASIRASIHGPALAPYGKKLATASADF